MGYIYKIYTHTLTHTHTRTYPIKYFYFDIMTRRVASHQNGFFLSGKTDPVTNPESLSLRDS